MNSFLWGQRSQRREYLRQQRSNGSVVHLRPLPNRIHRCHNIRSNYQEIIVPWGALHLPGVEMAVEEMGFEHRTTTYVPLITWASLGSTLFGDAEPEIELDNVTAE